MEKKLNELTVVQANDFVQQTNWTLDTVPLKLFKALVSEIDVRHPPVDNTVTAHKSELIKLLDTSGHNYAYLKRRLRQLVTSVKVEDNEDEEHYVALVQDIFWKKETDVVKVKFHEAVMPYLVGLKERFLTYPAANIDHFKSKYGLILYEYLMSKENQYHFGKYTMEIDALRRLTGTEKKHKNFRDLDKNVIKAAVDDINVAGVEILASYEKIKTGRYVTAVTFYVRRRNSFHDTNYDVISVRPDQLHEIDALQQKMSKMPGHSAPPEGQTTIDDFIGSKKKA